MKPKSTLRTVLLIASSTLLTISYAHAQNGTWLGATGNWNAAGTWSGGTIADGTDSTANFTGVDIAADQTVTLGVNRTIGNITFTDDTTPSNNLTISGNTLTMDVAGAPIIDVTQAGRTLTIGSTVAGNDGLQKNGLGRLVLNAATFTGALNVSAGTLDAAFTPTYTSANVAAGATWNFINGFGNNPSFTNPFTINGSFIKTGNGGMTFGSAATISGSGLLSFSGQVNIAINSDNPSFTGTINEISQAPASGGFNIGNNGALGAGLLVFGANSNDIRSTVGGPGYVAAYASTYRFDASRTFGGNGVNLDFGSGAVTLNAAGVVATIANTTTFGGAIGESGGSRTFGKAGAGTLVLGSANTYTGTTTISAGTLRLGTGGTTGSLSTSSAIVNNSNLTINRSNPVSQGTDFSAAAITGTGSFTQAGAGTTTLSSANTFSGITTVTAGTLTLTNALALQNSALVTTSGTSTLSGPATLTVGGLSGATGDLGSANVLSGYTGTITALTLNPQAGTVTYGGAISDGSGAMPLTKTGAGTQVLSGTNTYTGTTTISAGTLQFTKTASLYNSTSGSWTAANIKVANTGTLALSVGGTGEFTTGDVTTLLTNLGGANGTSTTGFASGAGIGFDTTNATGGTATILNTIANSTGVGGGAIAVTKLGTGTLILSGASTYTGALNLNGGTLLFGSTATKGSGQITINAGTFQIGTATPANLGSGQILMSGGALSSDSTTARTITNRFVMNGTFTLGDTVNNGKLTFTDPGGTSTWGSAPRSITVLSDVEFATALSGAGAGITKLGPATFTLSGANTGTGTNTVNAGTLLGTQTSGTPFGTGAMTIGSGILSLAPSGSGANISLAGGLVSATNNFTYNAGGTFLLNKGTNSSLTYTFSRTNAAVGFARGTNGTLILSVGAIGNLGNTVVGGGERFLITAAAAPVTLVNTLVSGVVAQDRGNSNAGDFVTYGATDGFAKATYTLLDTFVGATNASIVDIATATATSGATAAYAIKVGGVTLTNTGNTLTLGNGANTAGLILNGGTISGGTLTTPAAAAEFVIYTSGTSTISSVIPTATGMIGMSVSGPGTLALTSGSANTFTGGLRINNSTVIATNDNQLGGSTSQINLVGGTLQTSGTFALGGAGQRAIVLAAGQDQTGGSLNVTGGTTTYQNASASSKFMSGAGSLTKAGTGTLVLSGNTTNTHTGGTNVNGGTLRLGASNMLTDSGAVSLGAGTLDTQTFTDTVGTLDAAGSAVINLGTGGALAFANSSAVSWTGGTLNITGTFVSGSSLRFGTNSGGLTSTQLGLINSTGFSGFALNASGFLTATPTGGGNTYADWIATFPGAAGAPGFNQDADNDGVLNGAENFFGTNPSLSSGGLVATGVSGSTFTFTHPQNATPASDTSAAYLWSKDLATFNGNGAAEGGSTVTLTTQLNTPVAGTTTVTATVTGTALPKLFVRVNVIKN